MHSGRPVETDVRPATAEVASDAPAYGAGCRALRTCRSSELLSRKGRAHALHANTWPLWARMCRDSPAPIHSHWTVRSRLA
ncbi:unnamed protein product, partial [Iphiclides podalirius]